MKPLAVLSAVSVLSLLAGCASAPGPADNAPVVEATTPAITSLMGTSWALVRLQDQALVLPPNTRRPFLAFSEEGRLYGYTGVNRLSGQPEIDGSRIVFGKVATTRMAGEPEATAIEDRLLESLRLTQSWRVAENRLELLSDQSRVVAIFNLIPGEDTY